MLYKEWLHLPHPMGLRLPKFFCLDRARLMLGPCWDMSAWIRVLGTPQPHQPQASTWPSAVHQDWPKWTQKRLNPLSLICRPKSPTPLTRPLGPLRTRDWEPVTTTHEALSLAEKAEPVQVRFTTTFEGPTEYVNARWMWSLHGSLHGIEWIVFHGYLDCFQKPPLGGRLNTNPLGDHGTPNGHNCWIIWFYYVWGPAWIEIHRNSIRLRAWSRMTSHCTGGFVTTLHDFGGGLGWLLDTFFWALTISRSRLLARVWSDP